MGRFKGFWNSRTLFWFLFELFSLFAKENASNLPLLSGTLRTFQVHACDGDDLVIECYPATVISINLAQYGRQVPSYQLCPPLKGQDAIRPENETTNCLANEALRTVEAACQEQRTCKVKTSPDSFGGDPCPGVRKYAEVAYKCRPNNFFNKIICEGDRLRLRCLKTSRIVIYSAAFGGTHYQVPECSQTETVKGQDCQVSYATETVMSSCHGKRKCSVGADLGTFGSPGCGKGVRLYLKVVYTCVPKEILKDLDLSGPTSDNGNVDSTDNTKEGFEEDYSGGPAILEEKTLLSTFSSRGTPMAQPPDIASSEGKTHQHQQHQHPPDWTSVLEPIQEAKSNVHSHMGPPSSTPLPPTGVDVKEVDAAGGVVVVSVSGNRGRAKPTTKSDMQSDENLDGELSDANCTEEQRIIGFLTEWVNAYNYVKSNKEKFILYLTLSLTAGLVAFLLVLAARLYINKRREKRTMKGMRISEPLSSNAYGGDDLAELDAAFDPSDRLTTTALTGAGNCAGGTQLDPEMVRYGATTNGRGTMRRQESDTQPRAPVARNMNNYYYS